MQSIGESWIEFGRLHVQRQISRKADHRIGSGASADHLRRTDQPRQAGDRSDLGVAEESKRRIRSHDRTTTERLASGNRRGKLLDVALPLRDAFRGGFRASGHKSERDQKRQRSKQSLHVDVNRPTTSECESDKWKKVSK